MSVAPFEFCLFYYIPLGRIGQEKTSTSAQKKPLYIYDVPLHDDIHELRVQLNAPAHMVCFLTGNQRRAAAKERIKDDAIGHGRVSDRILAEIEDNHMRERDTKVGLAEQRQVAFLEIAFQILPLKSKQKRAP